MASPVALATSKPRPGPGAVRRLSRSCEAGLDSAPADLGLQLPASSLPLLPASPRPAPASSSVSDFLEDPLAVLRQVSSSDT